MGVCTTRTRARAAAIVAAATLGISACSGSSSSTPQTGDAAAPSMAATSPDLRSPDHRFEQVARFGTGRAVAAAASESATVIATTIGVELRRGTHTDAIPTSLPFPISDVVIGPDDETLVLLASTGAGELWSLDPLQSLASFDAAIAAHFTADGRWVDLIGRESARRLSTTDGTITNQSARATPGPITSVTWFGTDGHGLIVRGDSTSRSGEIWTGNELLDAAYEPGGIDRIVRAVGDPSGDRVVVGITGGARFSGTLVSLDVTTGTERWRHDIGQSAVQPHWSVGHDGRVLVVAGTDAQLYDLDGSLETSWQLGGDASVDSVVSYGDAPGYAIVRTDGAVIFVDANGARIGESIVAGTRLVRPAAVVASGGIVAPDAHGLVRRWDALGDVVAEITDHVGGDVNDVAVSPDGTSAAVATSDGNVSVIELAGASGVEPMPRRFVHPEGSVDTVAFVADGTAVVSGVSEPNGVSSFDDTLSRWELAADERGFVISAVPETISGCSQFRNTVRMSPDGVFFVAPQHDFGVSMRATADGSLIHEFPAHASIVWDLAISPDGRRLATSSDDWTLRVWDLERLELLSDIAAPPGGYPDIAFMPDSNRLVVASSAGTISLLDVDSGGVSTPFDSQKDSTARLSVSPDGRYVAAGADDGLVRIWDIETGEVAQELVGHSTEVTSVEFTPDGRGLVSGSLDGTARLWRV
jgi:WD40 repeat protein